MEKKTVLIVVLFTFDGKDKRYDTKTRRRRRRAKKTRRVIY